MALNFGFKVYALSDFQDIIGHLRVKVKKIYKRDKLLMKNHVNWNKIEQIENKNEIKIRVIQKKSKGIKNLILYYAHII